MFREEIKHRELLLMTTFRCSKGVSVKTSGNGKFLRGMQRQRDEG
jgi:hypothetical protein